MRTQAQPEVSPARGSWRRSIGAPAIAGLFALAGTVAGDSATPPPGDPGPAQTAPPQPRPQLEKFADQAQITLIEVPLNVTDRNGNPVRNLGPDDFEVWDDGKAQAVQGVETIDLQTLTPSRVQAEKLARTLPTSSRRH